ncbi:Paraquat-inducible protein B [Planctomycetes bacterium Pla163]|uniref:Paraquat-inducible protein B n=1 Tax=Rohdeia mirabilis TaxID=2528008 RepID=A0A518D3S4_9BACT|nr:Paraquat-inducible protein B [Planctomycetes bacterium Pla163]
MNDSVSTHQATLVDAPLADRKGLGWAWILPALAALLAVLLAWSYWSERGAVVEVTFQVGHGLDAGSDVRFRGTSIGTVESVRLDPSGGGLRVSLRLRPDAVHLAREGSRWWIPRPRVGLAGIEGLDTLLGSSYVTLEAGPADAPASRRFEGIEEPPVPVPWGDGLELVLEARRRGGLTPGAPVYFRQVRVGVVLSVGLASDGSSILARVSISPDHAALVRTNTVFWNESGLRFEAGLGGIDFAFDSIEEVLTGAIAFATPPEAGARARTGARFPLAAEADADWLDWVARLPVGPLADAPAGPRPEPVRAALGWKRKRLLGSSHERLNGWCLRLANGWIGPRDLLESPTDMSDVTLAIGGEAHEPLAASQETGNVRVVAADQDARGWPLDRIRAPLEPESCLVFGDPIAGARAIDATRLESGADATWLLGDAGAFGDDWHGAAVVARADGALIGILLVDSAGARIAVDVPVTR